MNSLLVHLASLLLLPAANNDCAVIVNSESSIQSLTKAELARIFRAETQFWDGGGKIVLNLPKSGSDAKEILLNLVYEMNEDELRRYWVSLVYRNKISEPPKSLAPPTITRGR